MSGMRMAGPGMYPNRMSGPGMYPGVGMSGNGGQFQGGPSDAPSMSPRTEKTNISKIWKFCSKKKDFFQIILFFSVPFQHSPVPGNPTPPLTPNSSGSCVGLPFASPASEVGMAGPGGMLPCGPSGDHKPNFSATQSESRNSSKFHSGHYFTPFFQMKNVLRFPFAKESFYRLSGWNTT